MTDQTNKLEPCPFCGGKAYIDQHGTRRQSCVISCHTCGCMLETNEEGANCGDQWNRRASAPAADQEAYEQECLNMTAEGIKYWKDKYEALVAASAPAAGSVPSEHALQSRWARIAASGEQYKAFVAEVRALLAQYGAPQDNVGATPTGLVSMAVRMPDPAEHPRVLIYTEGVDFNGEQFFDVDAESLNECRFESPDDQPEVCRHASHWMPLPPAPQEGK